MTCHGFPQSLHAKVGSHPPTTQSVPTLHLTLLYTSYALLSQETTTITTTTPIVINTRKQIYTRQLLNNKSFITYPVQQPTILAVSLVSLAHYAMQSISFGRRLKHNRFNGINKKGILRVYNNVLCATDYYEDIILIYSVKEAIFHSKGRSKYPLLARNIIVDHI